MLVPFYPPATPHTHPLHLCCRSSVVNLRIRLASHVVCFSARPLVLSSRSLSSPCPGIPFSLTLPWFCRRIDLCPILQGLELGAVTLPALLRLWAFSRPTPSFPLFPFWYALAALRLFLFLPHPSFSRNPLLFHFHLAPEDCRYLSPTEPSRFEPNNLPDAISHPTINTESSLYSRLKTSPDLLNPKRN
jgi:hypothetical protein